MPFIWIWIYCFATIVIMPGQLNYLLPPGLVGFLVFMLASVKRLM